MLNMSLFFICEFTIEITDLAFFSQFIYFNCPVFLLLVFLSTVYKIHVSFFACNLSEKK